MGIKISELPAASALAGTEPLPLVQAAETRQATVADIAPVRSVAGRTGAVALDPADCGAAAAVHTHDYAASTHTHDSDYADISHTHTATAITNTPAGTLAATTVQAALNELDSEKASTSHTHTGVYEPALGNPASNGLVLSSTAAGVRSWVSGGGGGTGYPSNLISSPFPVPADTSYIVMGELRIESDFVNNGNVGIL